MLEFDTDTFIRTKNMPSGPVYTVVESDCTDMEVVPAVGEPACKGAIGNVVSYIIVVGLILMIFGSL